MLTGSLKIHVFIDLSKNGIEKITFLKHKCKLILTFIIVFLNELKNFKKQLKEWKGGGNVVFVNNKYFCDFIEMSRPQIDPVTDFDDVVLNRIKLLHKLKLGFNCHHSIAR